MNSIEKARYLIENNKLMVISSADADGKPWISPVAFAYDESYSLYWVSSKDALHSNNVRNRPEVAIVIYGQIPEIGIDGVYVDAKATELIDETEIQKGIELFAEQSPQPAHFAAQSPADVTGDAAWRMYKAVPIEISKRADSVSNGQAITVREVVKL